MKALPIVVRVVILIGVYILMSITGIIASAHSQTLTGQLQVRRMTKVDWKNPVEAETTSHQTFLAFTDEVARGLHQQLDGKLSDSWIVTIRLDCSENHANDRIAVSVQNKKGNLLLSAGVHKMPPKTTVTKMGRLAADDVAILILMFDAPPPKKTPPPKDRQPPPNDPAPGRRAIEVAGAPLFFVIPAKAGIHGS